MWSSTVLVIALQNSCLKQQVCFNKLGRFIFFIAAFEAVGAPPMFIYPTTALSVPEALFKTTTGSPRSLLCQFRNIFLTCLFKRTVKARCKHKYFKGKGLSETNISMN